MSIKNIEEIVFPDEPIMLWYGNKREFYLPYPYSVFAYYNGHGYELKVSQYNYIAFGFKGFINGN